MLKRSAFPRWAAVILAAFLVALMAQPVQAFSAKPDDAQGAKVVGQLMATDFTRQCDVNTYPLQKNLSYLFDNDYMGVDFQSWDVMPQGGGRFGVVLHYVDGSAGPTEARWRVNLGAGKAKMAGENAEVLSCMTGYL